MECQATKSLLHSLALSALFFIPFVGRTCAYSSKTKVEPAASSATFQSGGTCLQFLGFMELTSPPSTLRKVKNGSAVEFRDHAGQVLTFPSPVIVTVIVSSSVCNEKKAETTNLPGGLQLLKDARFRLEWVDGDRKQTAESSRPQLENGIWREGEQNLIYDIEVAASQVPIRSHLLLTISSQDGSVLAKLDFQL